MTLTALLALRDFVWLLFLPTVLNLMLVEDMGLSSNGESESGGSLKHHLVAAHGARDVPVSALSNLMKPKDTGICQTCNVRFHDS